MAFEKTIIEFNSFKESTSLRFPIAPSTGEEEILMDLEYDEWEEFHLPKISETFRKEYEQHIKDGVCFYGCPFSIYEENYKKRLSDFLVLYPDATEIDFIKQEYLAFDIGFNAPQSLASDELKKKMNFSIEKTCQFLRKKSKELGYSLQIPQKEDGFNFSITNKTDAAEPKQLLKWHGDKSNLIELVKALIENGSLKGQQKDIFKTIEGIFNIKLNQDKTISGFRERNDENETKFLDALKTSLKDYIASALEKKRK